MHSSPSIAFADHGDGLNLDQDLRYREILRRDQRARREPALEEFSTNLHEFVAVRLIADEHRHGDDIGERAAGALERRLDIPERLTGLAREIADRLAVSVVGPAHAGEPHDASAV